MWLRYCRNDANHLTFIWGSLVETSVKYLPYFRHPRDVTEIASINILAILCSRLAQIPSNHFVSLLVDELKSHT
jgi:hypothetical protein